MTDEQSERLDQARSLAGLQKNRWIFGGLCLLVFITALCDIRLAVLPCMFNHIHWVLLIVVSFFCGVLISPVVFFIKPYILYGPGATMSKLDYLETAAMLAIVLIGPFDTVISTVNRYTGRDIVEYQQSKITEKYIPRRSVENTLRLAIQNDDQAVVYNFDIGNQIYDFKTGEPVKVGIQRGGLGFTYVASIDKL